MVSCQTGTGRLDSSVHTELHYNSFTAPECISSVYPWWIAVKQMQEVSVQFLYCTWMHQPCISLMDSCQTGPGSLGSSVHTELHYNYGTVPECISSVYPWWIAVKQVQEVWVVLFIQNYTIIPVLYLNASVLKILDGKLSNRSKKSGYNSCTVPECISPVDSWWIAVKQVQEFWIVLFIENYTIIPVL